MEAKDKAHLEQLAAEVETQLLRYVQVTPETKRQAQVVDAMRYSLEAGRQADSSGAGAGILPDFWRHKGTGDGGGVCAGNGAYLFAHP